jgi:hypothetical protein
VSENESNDNGGGLYVASGSATLDGAHFFKNDAAANGSAIFQSSAAQTTSMTGGCFANNTDIAVYNNDSESISIINSWWGSSTGPSGVGPGVGDSVSSNVVFDPFQTVSNGCPPRANASIYLPNILKQ